MHTPSVRALNPADDAAVGRLGRVAFGAPAAEVETISWAGTTRHGAFDGSGRLVAKVTDRDQEHWFGGRRVRATGIAGVAVAPEARGRGLARAVVLAAHAQARERGAVIGTLFPTAPALYRGLGYEQVGHRTTWSLPTSALAAVRRAPDGMSLEAAGAADLPDARRVYESVVSERNGYLHRDGPLWDWTELMDEVDGVTLARGSEGVEGYCAWTRGAGYDASAEVVVEDLFATSPEATRALLASLGSWGAVTGSVRMALPAADPVHLALPAGGIRPHSAQPWMLAVLDPAGAVAARGWPAYASCVLDLDLEDLSGESSSRVRLVVEDGRGRLEPGGSGSVRLHLRGLSLVYAGAAEPALLRHAGLLSGGSPREDELLRLVSSGPVPATNDYF